jgi:hypothetical protein
MSTLENFLPQKEKEEYPGIRYAINPVIELINRNAQDRVVDLKWINRHRHVLFITEKGLKYHMMFKRRYFMSFGKCLAKEGPGESVNLEMVRWAIERDICAFLFVHPDTHIYMAPVVEVWEYGHDHGTIRQTLKTGEETMSLPVKCLRRWR